MTPTAVVRPRRPATAPRPPADARTGALVAPRNAAPLRLTAEPLAIVLLLGFMGFIFVGTSPLSDGDLAERAQGDRLDQLLVIALFGLSGIVLTMRWRVALDLVRLTWPIWLVVGWCCLSVLWSDYPGITLRRSALLLMLTAISLAIVTGIGPTRRLLAIMVAVALGVILANLAATVLAPGYAFDVNGIRGIHSSKNSAGFVTLIATLIGVGWVVGAQKTRDFAVGGVTVLLGLFFLAITQSKTSLGLAVLGVAMGLPMLVAWRASAALGFALLAAVLVAGVGGVFAAAAAGWGQAEVFDLLVGDPTFTGRTEIWAFAVDEAAFAPLLGVGYGAFWDVGALNDPVLRAPMGSWLSQVEVGIINQAHSGYLDLWLQLGLPMAAVAVLAVALGLIKAFVLATDGTTDPVKRGLFVTACLTLGVFLIHNLMESSLFNRSLMLGNFIVLLIFATAAGWRERR